jgi:hypothetical protein
MTKSLLVLFIVICNSAEYSQNILRKKQDGALYIVRTFVNATMYLHPTQQLKKKSKLYTVV